MKDKEYYNQVYGGRYFVDQSRVKYTADLCLGTVLDLGCGDGILADFYPGDYVGVDFSEAAINLARSSRRPNALFETVDFLKNRIGGQWGTVVLGEILEHLDHEVTSDVLSKLAGNRIVVTVPNDSAIPDPAHAQTFTKESLRDLLSPLGFVTFHPYSDRNLVATVQPARPKLSVCIIAKDEEDHLPACLKSLEGVWDELVVVDTGSSDKTEEIARQAGAVVGHFPWCDSFSAARNYANDLATGEYLYIQDADEILLEGHDALRNLALAGKVGGAKVDIVFTRDQYGNPSQRYPRQVVFHRKEGWRWVSRAHNYPVGPPDALIEYHPEIVAEQQPKVGKHIPSAHLIEMLELDIEERGDERAYFYLAREYSYNHRWQDVINTVDKLLDLPREWPIQRSDAVLLKAKAMRGLKASEQAIRKVILKALEEFDGWREPFFAMGESYRNTSEWQRAIPWLLAATSIPHPHYFAKSTLYSWELVDTLALTYWHLGQKEEAIRWGKVALEAQPQSERLQDNVRWYAGSRKD